MNHSVGEITIKFQNYLEYDRYSQIILSSLFFWLIISGHTRNITTVKSPTRSPQQSVTKSASKRSALRYY